jgi:hypothetical protein
MQSKFCRRWPEGRKCLRNFIHAEARAMGIVLQNMPRFTENNKTQTLKVLYVHNIIITQNGSLS